MLLAPPVATIAVAAAAFTRSLTGSSSALPTPAPSAFPAAFARSSLPVTGFPVTADSASVAGTAEAAANPTCATVPAVVPDKVVDAARYAEPAPRVPPTIAPATAAPTASLLVAASPHDLCSM